MASTSSLTLNLLLLFASASAFMVAFTSATKLGHCGESCGDDPWMRTHICSTKKCDEPCHSHSECQGKLTCVNKKCSDDPHLRTSICKKKHQGAPAPHASAPIPGHHHSAPSPKPGHVAPSPKPGHVAPAPKHHHY